MFPLGVITWRLGNSSLRSLEKLQLSENDRKELLEKFSINYNGVFYLSTCQRIIIVIGKADNLVLENLEREYLEFVGYEDCPNVEKYQGINALRHLAKVIASLDSITIGEDQIHHQFKLSFSQSHEYMSSLLSITLQKIIRLGKRVRHNELFNQGRVSTISIAIDHFDNQIRSANSIGIIGTGKMGRNIINSIRKINNEIVVYSRNSSRVGNLIESYEIHDYNDLRNHEILIFATDAKEAIMGLLLYNELELSCNLIFDLSMPRNCNDDLSEKLHLVTLHSLLELSRLNRKENNSINQIYEIINNELRKIIDEHSRILKSKIIVELREDMLQVAEKNKAELIDDCEIKDRKYDLLVRKLLHVSQVHMENLIKEVIL